MNSSMRRASLGEMYSPTSKPRTAPPKRTGNAETSKRVIGPIPLSPFRMASQADFTVLPKGEMMPRPVTTTRRLLTRYLLRIDGWKRGCPQLLSRAPVADQHTDDGNADSMVVYGSTTASTQRDSGLVAALVDVLDGLLNRGDLFGVLVRNLDLELFFKSHHQLDGVERVGSEVVHEGRIVRDLFLFDAQLLGNDGLDLLLNCAH